jgi:hypothetical protein
MTLENLLNSYVEVLLIIFFLIILFYRDFMQLVRKAFLRQGLLKKYSFTHVA